MALDLVDYEQKAREAVKTFWGNREAARQKQVEAGKVVIDATNPLDFSIRCSAEISSRTRRFRREPVIDIGEIEGARYSNPRRCSGFSMAESLSSL